LVALAALAGCLADTTSGDELDAAEADAEDEAPELALEGEDCMLGGAQSVHPREIPGWNVSATVPDPWRVADVIEDAGEQYTYSEVPDPTQPKPQQGETWGHWHASMVCETWRLDGEVREDLAFGFVGPKVQTPGFAPSDSDDAFLATVVGTGDEALYEALQRGGVDVMDVQIATERTSPDEVAIGMNTAHNGEYLSVYRLDDMGPIEDEHLRLWYQHENVDGTYSPIAIDITREGGTHRGEAGDGYFHHSDTAQHWPLPGAYGNSAAAHYEGFDVSFAWGPTPDVTLEENYVH
jgi:hypothetical protein